jgi:adenine-specific DNA methylase
VIPKECKRLAEVDFPIAVVSKHAAREKSIRHGHPSTLHLWWARRPLASCRAMLLALLLPDPCDPHCPPEFKSKAREILRPVPGRVGATDEDLRTALLRFIGDFADWDHANNPTFLEAGRSLVKAAHPDETPLVVDPFAGGGSIPLEALRLGCDAFASDLNPVAYLILRTLLEEMPRTGAGLADELRRTGKEIKTAAEPELAIFYPSDSDGSKPIAYLWARTVRCEAPNCGAEIPLIRSFWLSKKPERSRALRYGVKRPSHGLPTVVFEIFTPKLDAEVPETNVSRARATCLCCGATLAADRVRLQLNVQNGGADVVFDNAGKRCGGARLLAVVTLKQGQPGRGYRLPAERDYKLVYDAQERLSRIVEEWSSVGKQGLCPVPDEVISTNELRRISVPLYGLKIWGDLFTARQKLALCTLSRLIKSESTKSRVLGDLLALMLDHTIERCCSLCRWSPEPYMETILGVFGRQALPMIWDFAEPAILSESTGSFLHGLEVKAQAVESATPLKNTAVVELADARKSSLPDESAAIWCTDPPYYDAVPYAHLSDFFYVWLKRVLDFDKTEAFRSTISPKEAEVVVDRPHRLSTSKKDVAYYESGMARCFAEGRRVLGQHGIGCIVFAHKTTEGWEALLSGIIGGGWTITASWPVATERANRLNARDTASLGTSVHLVCRPRGFDQIGDWAEVLRELPSRVADWMVRLEREGVRGADLVFACIGPALEIFSRYASVEMPDGREVQLPEYLEKVWEVVGRAALEQVLGTAEAQARNGGAGALEEDARLTALFLWTIKSTASGNGASDSEKEESEDTEEADDGDEEANGGKKAAKGFSLVFDIVRRFAQPLGIHLETWKGGIIEIEKGVVRLLPVSERSRQLLGQDGAAGLAAQIERAPQGAAQLELFPAVSEAPPNARGRRSRAAAAASLEPTKPVQATTLDRVHAAMLLQASGQTNALHTLLMAAQERGPGFLRLANALSALYPQGCEEKRLLDAMLLALPP